MKKILPVILIFVMVFSLSACEEEGQREFIDDVSVDKTDYCPLGEFYLSLNSETRYDEVLELVEELGISVEEEYFSKNRTGNMIVTVCEKEKGISLERCNNIYISFYDRKNPDVITGDVSNYIIERAVFRQEDSHGTAVIFDPRGKTLLEKDYILDKDYDYYLELNDRLLSSVKRPRLKYRDFEGVEVESNLLSFEGAKEQLEYYNKIRKFQEK